MPLPAFEKVGTIFSAPSWLQALSLELFFPRLFENWRYRTYLPDLPLSRFSILWSSDHSAGTGYIGRADADDIEGPWTDFGQAIHSNVNQREAPHPVYDPVNNRVNVYVHDSASPITNGSQAARLLTTTDLETLTDQGYLGLTAHHSGYGQFEYDADAEQWIGYTGWMGNENWINAAWSSPDGETNTWMRTNLMHAGNQHVVGFNNLVDGAPYFFTYQNVMYRMGEIRVRPRIGNLGTAIVAHPVDPRTLRPTGPYEVLLRPGTGTDDDISFTTGQWVGEIDGTLYMVYCGVDSDSENHIILARASSSPATVVALRAAVLSDGSLAPRLTRTAVLDWDAMADDIPSAASVVVSQGSDASSHSAGNYYEFKTGSGSQQVLWLRTDDTVDPTDHETVEFRIENLTYLETPAVTQTLLQIGVGDAQPTLTKGVLCFWSSIDATHRFGGVYHYAGSTPTVTAGYVMPYADTVANGYKFPRTQPVDVTFRIDGFGTRLSILVNGHVSYHRDISSLVTWGDSFAFIRLSTNSPHPAAQVRFTRFSLVRGKESNETQRITVTTSLDTTTSVSVSHITSGRITSREGGDLALTVYECETRQGEYAMCSDVGTAGVLSVSENQTIQLPAALAGSRHLKFVADRDAEILFYGK